MNIREYYGKKVIISAKWKVKYAGLVTDYIYADDNEPEGESIVIDSMDGTLQEFRPEDIESIEVIE